MRLRLPLYAQIVLWFFANLLVLALGAYALIGSQYRLGLDSLLLGRAGERVEALASLVAVELQESPRERWDEILDRFGAAYGIRCLLFAADGARIAGEDFPLPPEVKQRLSMVGPGPGHAPSPDGPREGFRRGPPAGRGPGARALQAFRGPLPKFILRTEDPRRYWVGVRFPSPDPTRMRLPVLMVLASESLSAGGLFMDWTPWLVLAAGAVVFSVLFWIPLVHRITRSISQMTGATERIAEGDFATRVESRRHDELGVLASGINRMAERLDGFVRGQKRFLGDVAHELCSPVARIQVALGILEARADERQLAYVVDVREEVRQMSELIDELLSFSRAGLGGPARALRPVKLAPLARKAAEREAGEARIDLQVDEALEAMAEPELLQRALANLVRNAVRYAASAGPVEVAASATGNQVRLTVADTGPGVAADDLQRIFDPFYRLESSRSRETGGVGLGLAIVKTCAEACGGTVSAYNRSPTGLIVELLLRRPPTTEPKPGTPPSD